MDDYAIETAEFDERGTIQQASTKSLQTPSHLFRAAFRFPLGNVPSSWPVLRNKNSTNTGCSHSLFLALNFAGAIFLTSNFSAPGCLAPVKRFSSGPLRRLCAKNSPPKNCLTPNLRFDCRVPACAKDEWASPRYASASARSLKRWILPVAVFGSSVRNSIQRGYL